jgi:hypothetical protein
MANLPAAESDSLESVMETDEKDWNARFQFSKFADRRWGWVTLIAIPLVPVCIVVFLVWVSGPE